MAQKKKTKDGVKAMKPQQSFAEMVSAAQLAKLGPMIQQLVYQNVAPIAQQNMNQFAEIVTRLKIMTDILEEKFEDITPEEIEKRTEKYIEEAEKAHEEAQAKAAAEKEEPEMAKTEDYFPVKGNEDKEEKIDADA